MGTIWQKSLGLWRGLLAGALNAVKFVDLRIVVMS